MGDPNGNDVNEGDGIGEEVLKTVRKYKMKQGRNWKADCWELYGYEARCVYDGAYATVIDHIIPQKLGGSDDVENLVPACYKCNQEKRDLIPFVYFYRHPQAAKEFLKRAVHAASGTREEAEKALAMIRTEALNRTDNTTNTTNTTNTED